MGKKKENIKTIEGRNLIKVSIFKDEYGNVGVSEDMTLKQAVTKVREQLELPERYKLGGGKKTAIRKKLSGATEEQLEEIEGILGE